MSRRFGADPPVFAKPTNSNATAASSSAAAVSTTQSVYQPYMTAASVVEPPRPMFDEARLAQEAAEANAAVEAARRADQEEAYQAQLCQQLRLQLTSKIQTLILQDFEKTKRIVVEEMKLGEELEQREKYLDQHAVGYLQKRMEKLETLEVELDQSIVRIQHYVDTVETEKKERQAREQDRCIDDVVVPRDIKSAQLLVLSAENAALSDALYFLDKALEQGELKLDDHLKNIRKLAQRQFMVRAHLLKIRQIKAMERAA